MARIRFTNTPLTKTADFDLSINPERWTDEIFKFIYKRHPYLTGVLGGDIDWSIDPIDETEGNATGAVTALVGAHPIQIPIIVRNGRLKDIDIYVTPEGEMDYLSEKVLMGADEFETVDLGQKVDPMTLQQGVTSLGGPMGNSQSRVLSKVASYGNFSQDVKRMAAHSDDERLSESWARIAAMSPEGRPFDALYMRDLGGHYKVAAYRRGYQIDRFDVSMADAFSAIGGDLADLARAARGTAVVVAGRPLSKTAEAFAGHHSSLETPAVGSGISIKLADGTTKTGKVLSRGSLRSDEVGSGVVWIDGDGCYLLDVQAHNSQSGTAPSLTGTDIHALKPGCQYAVVVDGVVRTLATYKGTSRNMSGEWYHAFNDMTEGSIRVIESKVVPTIRTVREDGRDVFVFPSSTVFYKADHSPVPAGEMFGEEKVASNALENGYSTATIISDGESFLCKTASDSKAVDYWIDSAGEATAWLMSLGATRESAEDCVKLAAANSGTTTRVYNLDGAVDVDRGDSDMTPQGRAKVARLLDRWSAARFPITKLAAEIGCLRGDILSKLAENPFAKKDEDKEEDAPAEEEVPQEAAAQEEAPVEEIPEEEMPAEQAPAEEMAQGPQEVPAGMTESQESGMEMDNMEGASVDQAGVLQDDLNAVNLLNQYNAQKFSGASSEIDDAKRNVANLLYRVRTGEVEEIDEDVIKDGLTALESILHGLREIDASRV